MSLVLRKKLIYWNSVYFKETRIRTGPNFKNQEMVESPSLNKKSDCSALSIHAIMQKKSVKIVYSRQLNFLFLKNEAKKPF